MGITTDRNDPGLSEIEPSGMQKTYLVLSDEERAKGFIRPVRRTYKHVGVRPKHPLRELTQDEQERLAQFGYVKFEQYPESESPTTGRFWTEAQLASGCGAVTTMGQALAETWARDVGFYGATYCVGCRTHLPVAEFVWEPDGSVLGS
jgi:hypothetical protein